MPRNRAAAIVLYEDNLLVMFRKNTQEYYVFPGGGIEADETIEAAALREIKEETSIDIEVDRQIYELHYDNGDIHYYFLSRYIEGQPEIMPDTNEFAANRAGDDTYKPIWLPIKELQNTVLYPLQVRDQLIKDCERGFSEEVIKFDLPAIIA